MGLFRDLLRDDPTMLYFESIPLQWLTRHSDEQVVGAARGLLSDTSPAMVLLGASYLLTSQQDRATAVATLKNLTSNPDPRIAALARAQLWRGSVMTVNAETIKKWEKATESMPVGLAAGPYYVIGQAWRQAKDPQRAAVAFMRAATFGRDQRPLAAQALVEAGRMLEAADARKQALPLYNEVRRDYPEQRRAVAEAESRLMME